MNNTHRGMYYLNIEALKEKATKPGTTGLRARHKLKTLERDDFKCIRCGSKEKLTIAHTSTIGSIRHRNAPAYNPKICVTLCVDCHLLEDRGI